MTISCGKRAAGLKKSASCVRARLNGLQTPKPRLGHTLGGPRLEDAHPARSRGAMAKLGMRALSCLGITMAVGPRADGHSGIRPLAQSHALIQQLTSPCI